MKPETAKLIYAARKLRREKGWGIGSIARELGVTATKVRRWCRGIPRGGKVTI